MSNNTEALKERQFLVILQRAFCSEGTREIEYSSDMIYHSNRKEAISHGFSSVKDDFIIGIIQDCRLVRFDWFFKPGGSEGDGVSSEKLAQIAKSIGLETSND